jgi:hypothetical protein
MSGTTVKEYHSETYKSEETKEEIIWLKQKFIWKTNGIVLRNQHKLQLSLIRVYIKETIFIPLECIKADRC